MARVSPAGGDGEVGGNRGILAQCLRGARNGPVTDSLLAEAFEVGADFEGGDAFDGDFGIEQGGDLAAEGGSGAENNSHHGKFAEKFHSLLTGIP